MLGELGITGVDIGASGIVILVIIMVLTARLVPKRYYDDMVRHCEQVTMERDNWRKVAETTLDQNTLLLAKDDVSITAIRAIRSATQEGREPT